jgi:anion-transporting  ArsA/GET3 family ATPase
VSTHPSADALRQLLGQKQVVVACGPGGVGKTTTAAALGAAVALSEEARVLVLTVDPARRLADALGLVALGNEARRVPLEPMAATSTPQGELWAAMLDTKQSWDALVRRYAPDAHSAARILANPLYRNITGRFAGSHEYIAMERLYEIHAEGRYDLVVVDTPPSRDALDFLDAPERMADFFGSRLLRWLVAPSRSRLVELASRPFYQVADRVLGTQFLEDIANFFLLFQAMYDGFVARARGVSALLRDPVTTFMVVTTLEPAPAQEAARLAGELGRRRLELGLLVANKTLPPLFDAAGATVAEELRARSFELAEHVAAHLPHRDANGPLSDLVALARVLQEIGQSYQDYARIAAREEALLAQLSQTHEVAVTVPHLARDVSDLESLGAIGRHLLGQPSPPRT